MPTLIHNTTVITAIGEQVRVLRAHSLAFEAGRITALGPAHEFAAGVARGQFKPVIQGTWNQLYTTLPVIRPMPKLGWRITSSMAYVSRGE